MFKTISIVLLFLLPLAAQDSLSFSNRAHHTADGFRNPFPGYEDRGLSDVMKWMIWDRFTGNRTEDDSESVVFEMAENDPDWLKANQTELTVTWVGHSSLLIQLEGLNILTDPVWSERVSPVSFVGPKRLVVPGIAFKDLPPIDVVIISHDHYDHLDSETIRAFKNAPLFLVPLGIGSIMEDWDVKNYQEMDWWDEISFNGVRFICTPTQHFSGRTLFDRNKTLWSSWVVTGKNKRVYFAGDTGYFPGFKEIGERFGPFDVAAIPIGAYNPRWFMAPVHVSPIEAVDVFLDVKANYFIPIHWGTFRLADEPFAEPPALLMKEVQKRGLNAQQFRVLKHGETFILPPGQKQTTAIP